MKKTVSILCIVLAVLLIPISCMADSSVKVNDLGFSVSLPDDLYVFTQDMDINSTVWDMFDVDPTTFIDYLKTNSIFLDAVAPDGTYEIVIIGRQDQTYQEIFNLNSLSDAEVLKGLSASMESAAAQLGLEIEDTEIYKTGNIKYFSFSGSQLTAEQSVEIKSYITVVNGESVQITLRSYAGALSNSQEALIEGIVDSINFSQILSKPTPSPSLSSLSSPLNSGSILYKALIAGIAALIFSIPTVLVRRAKKKESDVIASPKYDESVDNSNTTSPR